MRTIKFRGKRIDNGEWLYGDLMHDNIGGCYVYPIDTEKLYRENAVIAKTVGQYTGLKDKHGVEIYPGDILSSNGKMIGYVVDGVRAYCYDVRYINHPKGEKRWTLWGTVTDDYEGNVEVVGNIYDNPEMISRKEETK